MGSGTANWFIAFLQVILLVSRCKCDFSKCNYMTHLKPDHVRFFNNPHYPEYNHEKLACMYKIVAPQDYEIVVECDIELPRGPKGCTTDSFYISEEGDEQLHQIEQFCGSGSLKRSSLFRTLIAAYVSDGSNGKGARYNCKVSTRPQDCDCGWSQSPRIVGGEETAIGEFPSMVQLYHIPTQKSFCGGTIINHRTVLTAAHCMRISENANEILVIAGFHNSSLSSNSKYGAVYIVDKYIKFGGNTRNNDILLLITKEDIEWSRGVGPICLPFNQTSNKFIGTNVDLVGWGTTSFTSGTKPQTLQKTTVKIITNSKCERPYPSVGPSQVCTFFPGRDACQFDSGGPVIYRGAIRQYQLGIISYGKTCADDAPGVNTRITAFMDWILRNAHGDVCQKKFV